MVRKKRNALGLPKRDPHWDCPKCGEIKFRRGYVGKGRAKKRICVICGGWRP